jgi:hypothetical protein
MSEALAPSSSFSPVRFVRRHGVLILLMLIYATSIMDRQVMSILQEPIERELQLCDGQPGLFTGFSAPVFYSVLGVPIGKLSDRGSRRDITAAARRRSTCF